jgi:hypothetical protein
MLNSVFAFQISYIRTASSGFQNIQVLFTDIATVWRITKDCGFSKKQQMTDL